MVAKLIVHGRDRDDAIRRLIATLDDAPLLGLKHNARFLRDLVDHERFRAGTMTTTLIDQWQIDNEPILQRPVAPDEAWAVITPCHWAVQTNHITMVHPRALNLAAEESRALLAAMEPYFAGSGITLVYDTPTRWLARGPVFAGLATASPYRVVGGRVDDWIPKGPAARALRRLQQEMQMLLYTHPLTDARSARGALAVNSFWVSGTGAWAVRPVEVGQPRRQEIVVPHGLRDAAMREDWAAWAQAWQAIDTHECQALLDSMTRGEPAWLTLCGERSAWTWTSGQAGLRQRLQGFLPRVFGQKPLSDVLKQL